MGYGLTIVMFYTACKEEDETCHLYDVRRRGLSRKPDEVTEKSRKLNGRFPNANGSVSSSEPTGLGFECGFEYCLVTDLVPLGQALYDFPDFTQVVFGESHSPRTLKNPPHLSKRSRGMPRCAMVQKRCAAVIQVTQTEASRISHMQGDLHHHPDGGVANPVSYSANEMELDAEQRGRVSPQVGGPEWPHFPPISAKHRRIIRSNSEEDPMESVEESTLLSNRALTTCNTHLVQPQSRQCGLRKAADGPRSLCLLLSRHSPGLFQNSDFLRFPTATYLSPRNCPTTLRLYTS
ncbi:hypothetical protein Bbelb_323890 [Branchiostoma belcheri]|nr:hypothetical protein Bbelb_323890 [Branchiostoma belcheri]